MTANVFLTARDMALLLRIIEDWSYDVDLSISENNVLFEEVEELYNHLVYQMREMNETSNSIQRGE